MANMVKIATRPEAVRIDGADFYPREVTSMTVPSGPVTHYYIRQSNIPDMLRKFGFEWMMGNEERLGIMGSIREWVKKAAQGDGVIPAGELLAHLLEIESKSLFGYTKKTTKGEFGTNAHSWLEWKLCGGREPVLQPGVREACAPAEQWIADHKVEPVAVETVVFDTESGVAGRIDMAAKVDGIVSIVDWKTGKVQDAKTKELYLEVRLQNHLYRRGWSTMHGNGHRSRGGWIVKLPRDVSETFEAIPVPWDAHVMEMYDRLADAWRAMRRSQGKFAGGLR